MIKTIYQLRTCYNQPHLHDSLLPQLLWYHLSLVLHFLFLILCRFVLLPSLIRGFFLSLTLCPLFRILYHFLSLILCRSLPLILSRLIHSIRKLILETTIFRSVIPFVFYVNDLKKPRKVKNFWRILEWIFSKEISCTYLVKLTWIWRIERCELSFLSRIIVFHKCWYSAVLNRIPDISQVSFE